MQFLRKCCTVAEAGTGAADAIKPVSCAMLQNTGWPPSLTLPCITIVSISDRNNVLL